MSVAPKSPSKDWLSSYLEPSLVASEVYKIDTPKVGVKLDQNESPFDWPQSLKEKIVKKLVEQPWNRYPIAYSTELENLVADYVGLEHGSILMSPGSNHLVALTLSLFSRNKEAKVVVARPSFALYESHCRYDGIDYQAWPLNDDLQYDIDLMPELPKGSLVTFASPNNPVGNVLPKTQLKELLVRYPEVLFIADEAYFEFASEPYTSLLEDHSNLMLIRTFSKTLGAASLRLGYLVAAKEYIAQVRKMMLPYLVNRFTLVAAIEVLKDKDVLSQFLRTVEQTIEQRQYLKKNLDEFGCKQSFKVVPSQANFLLLRYDSDEEKEKAYRYLISKGILLRDVSKGPGLSGCLRLTVGTEEENSAVIKAFCDLKG